MDFQHFYITLKNIQELNQDFETCFPQEECKEHVLEIWLHLVHYKVRNRCSKIYYGNFEIFVSKSCLYNCSCNTWVCIKSLDRYGNEVFYGILYVSLAHISRGIAPFRCVLGETRPHLPTLSLRTDYCDERPDY